MRQYTAWSVLLHVSGNSGYAGVTKINTGKTKELGRTSARLALHSPRISYSLTWGSTEARHQSPEL